jgi:hypothetical protein
LFQRFCSGRLLLALRYEGRRAILGFVPPGFSPANVVAGLQTRAFCNKEAVSNSLSS